MSGKFFAFAALFALASALPSAPRPLSERQENTECWRTDPGTTFYRCANGFVGCFSSDPCNLKPSAAPTSTVIPTAAPTPTSTLPTVHEIVKPRCFNVYAKTKVDTEDETGHVDLNKPENSEITTTAAVVFENVPADAKNCRLMWRASSDPSNFSVKGKGQAWTRQLLGVPTKEEGGISYPSLIKYQDPEAEWSQSLDFTGWAGRASDGHIGPELKCAQTIAIEVKGSDEGTQENRVFSECRENNGLYMTWEE